MSTCNDAISFPYTDPVCLFSVTTSLGIRPVKYQRRRVLPSVSYMKKGSLFLSRCTHTNKDESLWEKSKVRIPKITLDQCIHGRWIVQGFKVCVFFLHARVTLDTTNVFDRSVSLSGDTQSLVTLVRVLTSRVYGRFLIGRLVR